MKWVKNHKVLTVVLVFVALIVIGAAAGGGSTTKTTTTSKTSGGTTTTTTQKSQPKWDAQAIYDQINAGMTKAQVEQVTGKTGTNCSQSAIQGAGTYEYCNYTGGFGSKGTISVTYQDGVVQTKSKLDF